MTVVNKAPSARQAELLELAYWYVLEHGLADLSLRPLAAAIGSSPRVLLFLFGSKNGLLQALLARARADELAAIEAVRAHRRTSEDELAAVVRATWEWLADVRRRPLLSLWLEAYALSLNEPHGPWGGFARQTVEDWLALLASAQPPGRRRTRAALAERTLALSVLRGGLIDLLATGEHNRASAAIDAYLQTRSGR